MNCPNCGAENALTNRFCLKCGQKLTQEPEPSRRSVPVLGGSLARRKPRSQHAGALTTAGITSIAGGGLAVLGWLTPWFSLGGMAGGLRSLLGIGSSLGFLNLGAGIGNGLQLTLLALIAGFAALSDDRTVLLGFLCLAIAVVLVVIPILGILNVRAGVGTFELAAKAGKEVGGVNDYLRGVRGRSKVILVIMVAFFLLLAIVPFGTSVLGAGFYLMAVGALCSYLGAFFIQSKLSTPVED